jgi:hypothetical protein
VVINHLQRTKKTERGRTSAEQETYNEIGKKQRQ